MTVKVEIHARNVEVSDRLREYIGKKVGKLDRFLDILEEARVELTYARSARNANNRQVAQVTVRGKGVTLRAEERTSDIFASVDAVLDKIYRQIDRYKGRHWQIRGDGRSAAEVVEPAESSGPEGAEPAIIRRKRFPLVPMDEREAVEQMALLGHEDFFVFLNAETNEVNVLYRRRDGTLGLLETEIA